MLPTIIFTISCAVLIALGDKYKSYLSDTSNRVNGRGFILKSTPVIRFIAWCLLAISLSALIAPPSTPPSLARKWLAPGLFAIGFIALISIYNIESKKAHDAGFASAAAYNEAQKLGMSPSQYKEFDTKKIADKAAADEASRKLRAEEYAKTHAAEIAAEQYEETQKKVRVACRVAAHGMVKFPDTLKFNNVEAVLTASGWAANLDYSSNNSFGQLVRNTSVCLVRFDKENNATVASFK